MKDKFNEEVELRTAPAKPTPRQIKRESEKRAQAEAGSSFHAGRYGVTSNAPSVLWELPNWEVIVNVQFIVVQFSMVYFSCTS